MVVFYVEKCGWIWLNFRKISRQLFIDPWSLFPFQLKKNLGWFGFPLLMLLKKKKRCRPNLTCFVVSRKKTKPIYWGFSLDNLFNFILVSFRSPVMTTTYLQSSASWSMDDKANVSWVVDCWREIKIGRRIWTWLSCRARLLSSSPEVQGSCGTLPSKWISYQWQLRRPRGWFWLLRLGFGITSKNNTPFQFKGFFPVYWLN